ncbi:MAG: hypothetical protein ACQESP_08170 [Candidatus Muiribacteriota bacterium]
MKKFVTAILFCFGLLCMAESIVTFPTSDQIKGEEKNLMLKIVIPNELDHEDEDPAQQTDFSYYNRNPFPEIDTGKLNWEKLKTFPKKGLLSRNRSKNLIKKSEISNQYDLMLVIADLLSTLNRKNKNELIDSGVTREDIVYISQLTMEDFNDLVRKSHINVERLAERLDYLKKQFRAGRGEVRVLQVRSGEGGETVIHLQLHED